MSASADQLKPNPLKFCNDCGFMLKPRGVYKKTERTEADDADKPASNESYLVNYCSKCGRIANEEQREVESQVVYANVILKDTSASLAVFSNDLIHDPTLMSTSGDGEACMKCRKKETVFFMSHSQKKGQEMSLVFICKGCGHKWLKAGTERAD